MTGHLEVLFVVATEREGAGILAAMGTCTRETVAGRSWVTGNAFGHRVGLLHTGVGKVNAGLALGAALTALTAKLLVSVGVGGAYPGSGLQPGDVAVATEEIYGDEGVETGAGFRGMEEIGFPLWARRGISYFNRFPADEGARRGLEAAAVAGGRSLIGPFVTVSTVTGTARRAADLEARYGAVCENMEGAAVAHAAAAAGARFGEVRGISNTVGPRDRAAWRLEEAAGAAQRVALAYLQGGGAR